MFTHEDNRRTLIEWATGEFKVAKVLIAKEDCVVGDHWHRNKDETFYLLMGGGLITIGGITSTCGSWVGFPLKEGVPIGGNILPEIHVPRGTYHRFELAKGSVLLGVGTEAFDPEDEIAGRPPAARPEVRYFTRDDYIKRGFPKPCRGVVTSVGPGRFEIAEGTTSNEADRIAAHLEKAEVRHKTSVMVGMSGTVPPVIEGDSVVFSMYAGIEVEAGVDTFVVLKAEDILCRVVEE